MFHFPTQIDPPCPPFVLPAALQEILSAPGFLKDEEAQTARRLYTDNAYNYDPFRDSSRFGTLCFLGYFEGILLEYERNRPNLQTTETAYDQGYVALTVLGWQRPVHGEAVARIVPRHADILRFLFANGAPLDRQDIMGYTALHHASMYNFNPEILKTLLELGADPNIQDRYGCVPLYGAVMNAQNEAVAFLLERNADTTIKDARGICPDDILLNATSQIQATFQRYRRRREGIIVPLEIRDKCGACEERRCKRGCARCRTIRYCDIQCQKVHWRSGHRESCIPFDADGVTTTGRVIYEIDGHRIETYAFDPLKRSYAGRQDGEGLREDANRRNGPSFAVADFNRALIGRTRIIKVQLPRPINSDAQSENEEDKRIMVYNRSRSFAAYIPRKGQPNIYSQLEAVVQEKGFGGLKGYFMAEFSDPEHVKIKTAQILAEQPW